MRGCPGCSWNLGEVIAEGEVTCGGGENFGGCSVLLVALARGPLDGPRAILGGFGEAGGKYRRTITRWSGSFFWLLTIRMLFVDWLAVAAHFKPSTSNKPPLRQHSGHSLNPASFL